MKNNSIVAAFIWGLFLALFVFPTFSQAKPGACIRNLADLRASTENRASDDWAAWVKTANGYLCALREGADPEVVVPLLAEALAKRNLSLAHFGTTTEDIVSFIELYYDKKSAEIPLTKYKMISQAKYLLDFGPSSTLPETEK